MNQLFAFIYRNRAFFLFVILEVSSVWLIVNHNRYQSFVYFTTANHVTGSIYEKVSEFEEYLSLKTTNEQLALENANLKTMLHSLESNTAVQTLERPRGLELPEKGDASSIKVSDSIITKQEVQPVAVYQIYPARVVSNSILQSNNYITLNKGSLDGMQVGMGVIGPMGVVGKIRAVSEHFSSAYSLLHSEVEVSAMIKKNNALCTIRWNGRNFRTANILYLAQDVDVVIGDTVVTSGFSSVYPSGIMIGTVSATDKKPSENFQDAQLKLSTDFDKLAYVYVIDYTRKNERDSVEQIEPNKK